MTSDTDTCQTCNNAFLVTCPNHGAEVDEDGWCKTCDTPADGPAGEINCECQDEED